MHYGVGYENAFWDGAEMVYGDGFAVNDVTAHELTHAVTERTAGLEYQDQPGALNESISDQAGSDVDPGDTTMGEDLPIGAIRDMEQPRRLRAAGDGVAVRLHLQRRRRRAHQQRHPEQGVREPGGHHGPRPAEQIRYRAQTVYLGPNATFADARAAEQQAASDLGYSSTSVGNAWQAQGVSASWQPRLLSPG